MIKRCTICGKEFETNNPRYKTCSRVCSHELQVKLRKGYKQAESARKHANGLKCRICGKVFPYNGKFQRYCSPECASAARRESHEDYIFCKRNGVLSPDKVEQVPFDTLSSARVKPQGVSDVRWRIELRRRVAAARLKGKGLPPEIDPQYLV